MKTKKLVMVMVLIGFFYACIKHLISPSFDGSVSDGYIRKGNSLGEKVLIDYATFDFAEEQSKYDWGLHFGAERFLGDRWGINAFAQVGLKPLFPADFNGVGYDLYNMFINIGASYRVF